MLNEIADCIFNAFLVAAFKVLDGSLLEEQLREPLNVLREIYHVDSLVLDECQNVDQCHVIGVDHWEDQTLNEYDLAFTRSSE